MNTLIVVLALLFVVLLLAQTLLALAYALSPRRKVDERLKLFIGHK